jgi:DNA-binding MarR family transcriptional regulator
MGGCVGKRRSRRVKYAPQYVAMRVLSDERLANIVSIVASNNFVGNGELARELNMSTGYVNYLCRKLEKWGVLRAYRDPVSGRILWALAETKTAELVLNELKKREAQKIEEVLNNIGVEV